LGELVTQGKKGEKDLDAVVLPRLALYGAPKLDCVPHIVRLLEYTDTSSLRVQRYAFYFLGQMLGEVRDQDDPHVQAMQELATKAVQQDALQGAPMRQINALGVLALAAVAGSDRARRELKTTLGAVLARIADGKEKRRRGIKFLYTSKSSSSPSGMPSPILQCAAFKILRCAFENVEELELVALQADRCTDPVATRHALAVVARLATREPLLVAETLGPVLTALLDAAAGDAGAKAAQASGPNMVLHDRLARMHLVHVCSLITNAPEAQMRSAERARLPFSNMLVHTARTASAPVMLECVHALAAHVPPGLPPTTRVRAWSTLVHATEPASQADKQSEGESKLLGHILKRLDGLLLQHVDQPVQSAACRAAGALAETHAHWDSLPSEAGGKTEQETNEDRALLASLARSLQVAMTSKNFSIRGLALSALIWLRTPRFLPGLLAAVEEQFQSAHWPTDAVTEVIQTLGRRLVVTPALASEILQMVHRIAECGPANVQPELVLDIWQSALASHHNKRALTLAAAQSFLRMLHSRHKPRGAALDPSERAAEQRLERTAVWFLGENANFATGEFAWADVRDAQKFARFSEFRQRVASARGAGWDDEMEAAAREEAAGRPLLGSVIRDLQTCALTAEWGSRLESVSALSKIALRSGEPFRLQCYSTFISLTQANIGLTAVAAPIIDLLDQMSEAQEKFMKAMAVYGQSPDSSHWDPDVLAQFVRLHAQLLAKVDAFCFVPPTLYLPMGSGSAMLQRS